MMPVTDIIIHVDWGGQYILEIGFVSFPKKFQNRILTEKRKEKKHNVMSEGYAIPFPLMAILFVFDPIERFCEDEFLKKTCCSFVIIEKHQLERAIHKSKSEKAFF